MDFSNYFVPFALDLVDDFAAFGGGFGFVEIEFGVGDEDCESNSVVERDFAFFVPFFDAFFGVVKAEGDEVVDFLAVVGKAGFGGGIFAILFRGDDFFRETKFFFDASEAIGAGGFFPARLEVFVAFDAGKFCGNVADAAFFWEVVSFVFFFELVVGFGEAAGNAGGNVGDVVANDWLGFGNVIGVDDRFFVHR